MRLPTPALTSPPMIIELKHMYNADMILEYLENKGKKIILGHHGYSIKSITHYKIYQQKSIYKKYKAFYLEQYFLKKNNYGIYRNAMYNKKNEIISSYPSVIITHIEFYEYENEIFIDLNPYMILMNGDKLPNEIDFFKSINNE